MDNATFLVNATNKRVGLGKVSPQYDLDVVGDVNITGSYLPFPPLTFQTNGRHMFPADTADTSSIAGLGGTLKWIGGVLAPNGKIYGIPYSSTSVLIIDPVANTANTTAITGLGSGNKWLGGVLAPNGKIYGMPLDASSVLIIDPVTNTANTTTITGLSGLGKWNGGVLAPNGKIYGIPYSSPSVLIIDPVTNTADTTAITGLSGDGKWRGGVLAPNGKIYGIPWNSESVLIIDPVTNTANTTAITGLSGSAKWSGGVLAPNAKIYGMPRNASSVLIIDPVTTTAITLTPVADYRYYRFTPTQTRTPGQIVQIAELDLRYNGARVNYSTAVASNPGGNNRGGEEPSRAIDNNVNTKWLELRRSSRWSSISVRAPSSTATPLPPRTMLNRGTPSAGYFPARTTTRRGWNCIRRPTTPRRRPDIPTFPTFPSPSPG